MNKAKKQKNRKILKNLTSKAGAKCVTSFVLAVLLVATTSFSFSSPTDGLASILALSRTSPEASTENIGKNQPAPDTKEEKITDCTFTQPDKPTYTAKTLSIRRKKAVAPGEIFKVQVYVQNVGNTPWFSKDSGCDKGPVVNLGTTNTQDRSSPFYAVLNSIQSNWLANNRIKMETKRVDPLAIGAFTFFARAPETAGIYREYYAPVVEGVTWMGNEGLFSTDITVGDAIMSPEKAPYLDLINESTNLTALNLDGEKKIVIDLSEQKMGLKVGDTVIKVFPMSSGKKSTPTPKGKYKVLLKQEVRVGGKYPHYIMPKFMMFRKEGYAIHALPSLANDHGVFWNEALNHIGTPRSHGCVRLLPGDANLVWNFADVGTPIEVHA